MNSSVLNRRIPAGAVKRDAGTKRFSWGRLLRPQSYDIGLAVIVAITAIGMMR
jgi:hypothetical protein